MPIPTALRDERTGISPFREGEAKAKRSWSDDFFNPLIRYQEGIVNSTLAQTLRIQIQLREPRTSLIRQKSTAATRVTCMLVEHDMKALQT